MKRILVSALTIAIMMVGAWAMTDGAYATVETDWTQARYIEPNQDVKGNVTDGYRYEQDTYCFELPQDGVISIRFSNPLQADAKEYWDVYLVNDKYEEILSRTICGNYADTDLVKTGLPKGTYYIEVTSSSRYEVRSTDTYTLNVGYEASGNWEKEFNEDYPAATPVAVNKPYYGTIRDGFSVEADVYRFDLTTPGAVSLQVSYPQQANDEEYWEITLFNGAYDKINSWSLYGSIPRNTLTGIGLPAGTYYVKMTSSARYDVMSEDTYTLNIGFGASAYWEKEFNDDPTRATPITLGTSWSGTIYAGDYDRDLDYYAIDIPQDGEYTVRLKTKKQETSDNYWKMTLRDASYGEITSKEVPGNKTTRTIKKWLAKGRYYVQITKGESYPYNWSADVYQLRVGQERSITKAKISGIKSKYVYTGKAIAPVPVVRDNGIILSKGSSYSVSYSNNRKVGRATVYVAGIYPYVDRTSKTFKIVPKGTKIKKVNRLKKGFKVKWKQQKVQTSGYQIQYSRKSSMKSAKKKTIYGKKKTVAKIKGLKAKKKYYVRVRTFKKVNGEKFYSAWSRKTVVRTK